MEKRNPVGWFEIYVQDMERAKKFYQEVFKIEFTQLSDPTDSNMQMFAFPSTNTMNQMGPGCSGTLVKMDGIKSGGGGTLVYFTCDDCSVEEGRVVAAGGSVHTKKMSIGEYGFMSLVVDTETNMIGLHSLK